MAPKLSRVKIGSMPEVPADFRSLLLLIALEGGRFIRERFASERRGEDCARSCAFEVFAGVDRFCPSIEAASPSVIETRLETCQSQLAEVQVRPSSPPPIREEGAYNYSVELSLLASASIHLLSVLLSVCRRRNHGGRVQEEVPEDNEDDQRVAPRRRGGGVVEGR